MKTAVAIALAAMLAGCVERGAVRIVVDVDVTADGVEVQVED